jgi:hypothetical protein
MRTERREVRLGEPALVAGTRELIDDPGKR